MARRTFGRGALVLLGGGAIMGLLGCGSGSDRRLRYKISVEADTMSGPQIGSSVVETDFDDNGFTFGQAPYVDLGRGQYVFALLNDPFSKKIFYRMVLNVLKYPELQPPLDPEGHLFAQAKEKMPVGVVRREDYPMLVTFGDIDDPKTVREVDGSMVRRITLQVVDQDEPLTTGFEERFAEIAKRNSSFRQKKWSASMTDDVPGLLSSSHFVWRQK